MESFVGRQQRWFADHIGRPTSPLPTAKTVDSEASITPSLLVFESARNGAKIVDEQSVEFGKHIGTGATMQVHEGRHNGKAVALKILRAQKRDEVLQSIAAMRLELNFSLSDNIRQHPNIVKVIGFTWQDETGHLRNQGFFIKPILLVELASPESPTLDVLIRNLCIDDFATKASLISDIIQGLDAVHGEFLIHGDLKPENVLIFASEVPAETPDAGPKFIAKLSDFGYSDDFEVSSTSRRWNLAGTEYWSPPECFTSAHGQLDDEAMSAIRSESRDLYSLGLIIWYIISSKLPLGDDRGSMWSAKRQQILQDKTDGKVVGMASAFVRDCLSPLRPVANIAPDVLQISSLDARLIAQVLGGNRQIMTNQVAAEIADDIELFEWLIHVWKYVALPGGRNAAEDMIRSMVWEQLKSLGGEWACPEHPGSLGLLQKIDLRDSSHGLGRFILVDELLFRGKLIWTMTGTPCRGYLPHAVIRFPRLLSVRPADRGTVREWLQYLQISPKRTPSSISSWRPETQSSLRGAWSQGSVRKGDRESVLRNLQYGYLSPRMISSLSQQIQWDRKNSLNSADSVILDFMEEATAAEQTAARSAPQAFKHYISRRRYDEISVRQLPLSFYIAGQGQWAFDDAVISEYCIENLCIHLYEFEKEVGSHPVDDSFFRLIMDTLGSIDEAARKRTPRLWYDVYSKPERQQKVKQTTLHAIVRPKRRGEPGFNPDEAELAMSIRQDDMLAFKDAHQSGNLPAEIDPKIESGANALVTLMIELHLKNILSFCLEAGIIKVDASVNGFSPLQRSVQKGSWTTAATLLDFGANVSLLFHNTFVEEVITYGSKRSIYILFWVQRVASTYPNICSLQEPIEHIAKFDFNDKRFKTRPTDDEPGSSAVHLAILENAWTTFAALVSLGADIEKSCCQSMNPIQWAVGLLRPIFVGALIDAGANPNVRTTDTLETPLHELVQLDTTRWPNRWIYGDSEALRAKEEALKDDQTHADIILELLLRAPNIDKEARDAEGATPFLAACSGGNIRMCQRLASAGANKFARMRDGRSALHLAIEAKNSVLVEYLCSEWPEMMKMEDGQHRTPLTAAVAASAGEILAVMEVPPPATPSADIPPLRGMRILGLGQQDFEALEILFGHCEAADPGSVNKALAEKDSGSGSNAVASQSPEKQRKGFKDKLKRGLGVFRRAHRPTSKTMDLDSNTTTNPRAAPSADSATDAAGASSLLSGLDGYRIRQRMAVGTSLVLNPRTGLGSRIIPPNLPQPGSQELSGLLIPKRDVVRVAKSLEYSKPKAGGSSSRLAD